MGNLESDREWPPPDLLGYITELRKLIALDRKRYAELKASLYPAYPDLWEAAGAMIKARARYYNGEMIRAKQDTYRFSLGEDPQKPSNYGSMACQWAEEYLNDLRHNIALMGTPGDPHGALVENTKQSIVDITNDLERITYGG